MITTEQLNQFNRWLNRLGCVFYFSAEDNYFRIRLNNSAFLSSYQIYPNGQFRNMVETYWDAKNIKILWNNDGTIFWGGAVN